MATKVYRNGGFVVVEQAAQNLIPLRDFDFEFPVPTNIKLLDMGQKIQYTDTTANIQDEFGTPIGDKNAVTDYLAALVDAFGGGGTLPTGASTEAKQDAQIAQVDKAEEYRYFEHIGGGFPDEFQADFQFSYYDGVAIQNFSVDLTGTVYNDLSELVTAINGAQSIFVFEVAQIAKMKGYPAVNTDNLGITDGTQPAKNYINGTLVIDLINVGISYEDIPVVNIVPSSSGQAVEKNTFEALPHLQNISNVIQSIDNKTIQPSTIPNSFSRTTGSGAVLSSKYVSIYNSGNADGLVNGAVLKKGEEIEFPYMGEKSTHASISYDATGTEFAIQIIG